ncbi:TonB C-terminal domain-containing protein [Roseateles koreensis]|uniref:TonB C-terminal domain-containing protein n=1 Tax=Roseateles koreensis TaxID=2987526 RepID=A0ABT5KNV1_9BURK|nr:TonB C-terminal domain-containing protein [Roseateles koreensis]MDC8784043.1 TonB C-terminal domain-containing protein [Roseateles koreensis]
MTRNTSGLAEDHLDDAPSRVWWVRGAVALAFVAVVALVAWTVSHMKVSGAPKHQVAKISILPDTPPPPPPPPKDEKKPEPPKDEPKQVMREEQLKQAEAPKPANEPIKMEGAAGDGPSAFAGGSVGREYSGGTPATGAAGGGLGTNSDRAQERFYANTVRQMLRDAVERHFKSDATQATAEFSIWVARDGGIGRYELRPTGDARLDEALTAALDETTRALKLPAPPLAAAQPMKFRLNLRPLG